MKAVERGVKEDLSENITLEESTEQEARGIMRLLGTEQRMDPAIGVGLAHSRNRVV